MIVAVCENNDRCVVDYTRILVHVDLQSKVVKHM